MTRDTAQKIRGVYDAIEEFEPDISTERLLATTAVVVSDEGILLGCDVGDVAEALFMTREEKT